MLHKGNSSTLALNLSQHPLTHSYITPPPSSARTASPHPPHYVVGFFLTFLPSSLPQLPLATSYSLSFPIGCPYSITYIFPGHF